MIGPLEADGDGNPSGLGNKLRVEVPSTGGAFSLFELGFCGSAEELELKTTGDGSLVGVDGIEVLVSFRQDWPCRFRTSDAIPSFSYCSACRLSSAIEPLEWCN